MDKKSKYQWRKKDNLPNDDSNIPSNIASSDSNITCFGSNIPSNIASSGSKVASSSP